MQSVIVPVTVVDAAHSPHTLDIEHPVGQVLAQSVIEIQIKG